MRVLALLTVIGLFILLSAFTAPAATVERFEFGGEATSASSLIFTSGGIGVTVSGTARSRRVTSAAKVTRAPDGIGIQGGASGALDGGRGGRKEALVLRFGQARKLGALGLTGAGGAGLVRLIADGELAANLSLADAAALSFAFPDSSFARTLRLEARGAANGLRVSTLTLVAPVPAALPLILTGLATLAFLARRRRTHGVC